MERPEGRRAGCVRKKPPRLLRDLMRRFVEGYRPAAGGSLRYIRAILAAAVSSDARRTAKSHGEGVRYMFSVIA
jgi:hypothetical protein